MAGRGPAPKAPTERRRRNAPERGEWTDLAPLKKIVLPALPRRSSREGAWSARTRRQWEAWRKDRVTDRWGPAAFALAEDTIYLFEDWVREGGVSRAAEIRQRMDNLALTEKGKRDQRLRVADDAEHEADETAPLAEVRRLRAVDPASA